MIIAVLKELHWEGQEFSSWGTQSLWRCSMIKYTCNKFYCHCRIADNAVGHWNEQFKHAIDHLRHRKENQAIYCLLLKMLQVTSGCWRRSRRGRDLWVTREFDRGQSEAPHPVPVPGMYFRLLFPQWEPFSRRSLESKLFLRPGLNMWASPSFGLHLHLQDPSRRMQRSGPVAPETSR